MSSERAAAFFARRDEGRPSVPRSNPARRDIEVEAYSAVLSDEVEMPHLVEIECDINHSSDTSDHYREAMNTSSEGSMEDEVAQIVLEYFTPEGSRDA